MTINLQHRGVHVLNQTDLEALIDRCLAAEAELAEARKPPEIDDWKKLVELAYADGGDGVTRIQRITAEYNRVRDLNESHKRQAIDACKDALLALSGARYCTPEETYGSNIFWAMQDLIVAFRDIKSVADGRLADLQKAEKLAEERGAALLKQHCYAEFLLAQGIPLTARIAYAPEALASGDELCVKDLYQSATWLAAHDAMVRNAAIEECAALPSFPVESGFGSGTDRWIPLSEIHALAEQFIAPQATELAVKAKEFAITAHAGQKYGTEPYIFHVEDVVRVLLKEGFHRPVYIAAAYLHDVLEDTKTTVQQLLEMFPVYAIRIVQAVTDEPGKNRAERHSLTYPKIAGFEGALIVKLADRIANVEYSIEHKDVGKLWMYQKEHSQFRDALYSTSPRLAPLWKRLERSLGMAS